MAKVQIKPEQITPFGGIFSIMEQFSTHLMHHLSSHPKLKTCSADTILRAIKELTVDNTTYTSLASGKSYDFNTADKMNELLVKSLLATGGLRSGQEYDLDFDHQFIQAEKYDAKRTYKKFFGYSSGVAVIGNNWKIAAEKTTVAEWNVPLTEYARQRILYTWFLPLRKPSSNSRRCWSVSSITLIFAI